MMQQSDPTLTAPNMIVGSTGDISFIDIQARANGNGQDDDVNKPKKITLANIIGEFGIYQLSITLLAFMRYICLAMMTNTGPLIAPDVEFWCQVPDSIKAELKLPQNVTLNDYLKVCENDVYRSTFQSAVSFGVVVASVIWGSFSDVHGRNFAIRICFIISLISGIASYLAKSYFIYTISRAICSLSDLGLVVSLSTIIVELLGNKYRGAVCIIVYTGWSIGVMVMPWLTEYFRDYRQLMLFTVICQLSTLPWLLTVQESIRWSMVNGKIDQAKAELIRICRWNGNGNQKSLEELESKFEVYKRKFVASAENKKALEFGSSRMRTICLSIFGGLSKVVQLFHSKEMAIATITMIWITFTSELLYMFTILINSDIGDDVKLNYAIGGIMEVLATLMSIVIISKVSRKLSLSTILLSIALLSVILAFTHQLATTSIFILNAFKLAISTLSSLVFVATTETFPTDLRQTGFGLCGTIGSLGAVVAPFMRTELTDTIGLTYVMMIVSLFPLVAVLIIPFFLRETQGVELADEIDDLE